MPFKTEEIYRALLLNTADAVALSDASGIINFINPAFAKLIGADEAEIIGHRLHSFIVADWLDNSQEHSQSPNAATVLTKTGTEFVMPVAHFPMTEKESRDNFLTIVYVIQANSLQQAQTEFVSTVSHELRTPLTSIKGFADTILRAGDRLDTAQQRRYVGIIRDQADRLTRLVEDLLAVSRLESKKLQLTIRALDLKEAIERVEQNLCDKAKNHQLVVQIPPGLTPVWADSDRLEQILTNLIDNAIKYSPQGTIVTVTATVAQGSPEMIEFSVKDQGVGIPEEHLPQVFSKFGRLDNPLVRQTEGTGLGLYITRSLVLALCGQISVESVPGCTTFTVKLPAATFEQQAARSRI
jgi:two-component system phosphate regulon sensor histidine kinase PhoR